MTALEWVSLKKGDKIITPRGSVRTVRRVHFWKRRRVCSVCPKPVTKTGCIVLENGVTYCMGDRRLFEVVRWGT